MIAEVSNWQELGIFLGLDSTDINIISNDYEPREYRQQLVEKWFSREPERSWEKLQRALDQVGTISGSQTSNFSLPSTLAPPMGTYVSEGTDKGTSLCTCFPCFAAAMAVYRDVANVLLNLPIIVFCTKGGQHTSVL